MIEEPIFWRKSFISRKSCLKALAKNLNMKINRFTVVYESEQYECTKSYVI